MKNLIFILAITFSFSNLFAQSDEGCHAKYVKVFEVRGANQVADGEHKDVVITVRKGSFEDCFIGKVEVKDGLVDKNSIQLTFVDGTFENFNRAYKSKDPARIINGMSETMITQDEELINVLFVSAIKPKKKAYKRAPEPDFNLK